MSRHEDAVREEQRHVDRAYERLEVMRDRAEQRRRDAMAASVTTHADLVNRDAMAFGAAARVQALTIGDEEPLVFGRIDHRDGERFHIGRVSVLSEDYDPLVVDWRSDVASAFYSATPADPHGLHRRRVIHCRGRTVLGVEDHLLDTEGGEPTDDLVGDAALMAALTRERSDHMRDIVATIQREQDEIIRLPAAGTVVVAGGPGTGKTAVALHRVAYLLYRHRERLERRGVLVVGPSAAFAEYIRGVLPSLGETSAVLRPLGGFVPGLAAERHDPPDVGSIKGDVRMAAVLAKFAATVRRTGVIRAFERLRSGRVDLPQIARGVLKSDEIDRLLAAWSADHTAGRPPSVEDVALIDELDAALRGDRPNVPDAPRRDPDGTEEVTTFADREVRPDVGALLTAPDYRDFGHVVVDEAQDLSGMQWRMVARRGPAATWTVVGDLAQQSTPAAPVGWEAVVDTIGRTPVRVKRLSVNYRTPAPIMDLASRLLPKIAPGQEPTRAARTDGPEPEVHLGVADVAGSASRAAHAARHRTRGTVAVVAPEELTAPLRASTGDERIRVLDPWTAKGLEFDAVVVAAPERITDTVGWGALYVALTRATHDLTVISAAETLPGPLAAHSLDSRGDGA